MTGCRQEVPEGGRSVRTRPCTRAATRDGYCGQHHPDAVAFRRQQSDERAERRAEQSPWGRLKVAQQRIQELEAELAESLDHQHTADEELIHRGDRITELEAELAKRDEPCVWEFQHEETGTMIYADQWQLDHGFEKHNPRYQKIGPLYRHPIQMEDKSA